MIKRMGKVIGWKPHYLPKYKEDVPKQFMYQSVDRDCDLTLDEVTAWQNILKKSLPTNTIYRSIWNQIEIILPQTLIFQK